MRAGWALALIVLVFAVAAKAAAQGPPPVPAKPQVTSLDSDAPPGAPPHWLPDEPWVWLHWLPYDETRLYALLHVDRPFVWRWLRDDSRTLADLARQRGWDPSVLARELVAPWRGQLRDPGRLQMLERRALRTLTQGHLSQHLLFHSLHQSAVPEHARAIFGVRGPTQFAAWRRSELSPLEICRLNGISGTDAARHAAATLRAKVANAVARQAMPPAQAKRLLDRQLSQLPRWLRQSRYNGPPPLAVPRASESTAANYSNNAALAIGGGAVVYERYEASVALAKARGEINVMERPLAGSPEPMLVSEPLHGVGRDPRSSYNPVVSRSGRFVAYESAQGNLNFAKRYGKMTIFVRDTRRAITTAASPGAHGAGHTRTSYNPTISGDGRRVAYESYVTAESASGNVGLWVTDLGPRLRRRQLHLNLEELGEPRLSGNGRYIAFSGRRASERYARVWRADLRTDHVVPVSDQRGDAYEPDISADGQVVAYSQLWAGASRVLRRDLRTPARASRVIAPSVAAVAAGVAASEPAVSADGSAIAYTARGAGGSTASVFAWREGRSTLVSRARGAGGPAADGASEHPSISSDGRLIAFTSNAWNLSAGKCNPARGIFIRDLQRATTTLVSAGDDANRFLGATRGSSAPGDMTVELVCARPAV